MIARLPAAMIPRDRSMIGAAPICMWISLLMFAVVQLARAQGTVRLKSVDVNEPAMPDSIVAGESFHSEGHRALSQSMNVDPGESRSMENHDPAVVGMQGRAPGDDSAARFSSGPDSIAGDTLPRPARPRLLPGNMSFMERGLWGENGLVRSFGIASPLTPEVRKHELGVRRTMLTMHQIGGFATLGSMIATVYFGQKSLNDPNTGQPGDPYRNAHQAFEVSTILLYATTGLLAVLSPPPLIRREETSTTTIHKTLAWIHVAGMILTPILGGTILKRGPVGRYADLNRARFHQIAGYATTAVFAASMIIVMF